MLTYFRSAISSIHYIYYYNGNIIGDFSYTYGGVLNDLTGKKIGNGKVLDYILIDENGTGIKPGMRKVRIFQKEWKKGKKDLSDHYAVEAILKFMTGSNT